MAPLNPFARRRYRQNMTAAAERLNRHKAESVLRVRQTWQQRAFTYHDLLGEIWYASKFYSRALSRLRFYVADIGPDGEIKESTNPADQDALKRLQMEQWIDAYGQLMFLNGEGTLMATTDENGDELWEFVSVNELRVQGPGSYMRIKAPGLIGDTLKDVPDEAFDILPDTAIVYRLWKKHPQYSMLADAPMRGVLDLCEELHLLTQAIRAKSLNRAAGNGILLIPDEASLPSATPGMDEDPKADPLIDAITEAMMAPLSDPGAASSAMPLPIRTPAKYEPNWRHLSLRPDDTEPYPEGALRADTLKRIAIGLDMPPERLLGSGDSNHWSEWNIDEQTWKAHLEPLAVLLCTDLTRVYLQPTIENPDKCIWYDPANVVNHPNRSADAIQLHDRGALSDWGVREANNFGDEYAPSPQNPSTNPHVVAAEARAAGQGGPSQEAPVVDGSTTDQGPPPQPTDVTAAAISVAVERCRELAGARIRTRAQRFPNFAQAIEGVDPHMIAPTLGDAGVQAVAGGEMHKLVAGGATCLLRTLTGWGMDETRALVLCGYVEQHAGRTLTQTDPDAITPADVDELWPAIV